MKEKWHSYLTAVCYICLVVILVLFYFRNLDGVILKNDISKIEAWTQIGENGFERNIVLPEVFDSEKDEYIEIETVLPEDFDETQLLCFWTNLGSMEVRLDETLIYSLNDIVNSQFGKSVVSGWHYIETPENSAGQCLTIRYASPYETQFFKLDEVVYGTAKDVQDWMRQTYGLSQLLDYIFICMGITFILLSIWSEFDVRYKKCQFFYGVTAVLVGFWMRVGTKGIPVYALNLYTRSLLGYIAFLCIPVTLTFYVKTRVLRIKPLVIVSEILILLQSLIIPVLFGLQACGVRDIQENIWIGQFSLTAAVVWAVIVALYYFIKERARISILTVINAFLLLFAVGILHIQFYQWWVEIDSGFVFRLCILVIIVLEFVMFFSNLRKKERIQRNIQKQNQNLQLHILTSQIRPHFILNTLGAIRSMIRQDSEYAYELLYDFSKYIRRTMEEKDYRKPIPFLEELEYIETYLKLEKLRFGDRLKVEYDIQVREFWVLPLTIQPFVENAVKHGIMELKQGGTVWIRTRRENDKTVIEIEDNGIGFDTSNFWSNLEEEKSVGMRSAIYRLQYEFGGKCTVKSNMTPGKSGTYIRIDLPIK